MMTLSGLVNRMIKNKIEWANGRIDTAGGCWTFDPTEAEIHEDINRRGRMIVREDGTGRAMCLVSRKSVSCSNMSVCADFPLMSDGTWSVPHRVCRKCEHYRKGKTDGLRYPHCAWARSKRGGTAGGKRAALTAWSEANARASQTVKEILG